jgi:hemerythrin-like domain-containing protein
MKRKSTRRTGKSSTSRRRGTRNDAIALLKKDHDNVLAMFRKFNNLANGERGDRQSKETLAQRICEELKVHTTIEEEIFYPAVRAEIDENLLMNEAQVEHDGAKNLIEQIESMRASDDMFDAKVTVLGEMIKHHVKEEQEEIFPKARKAKVDLDALGEQLAARKQEIAGTRDASDPRY